MRYLIYLIETKPLREIVVSHMPTLTTMFLTLKRSYPKLNEDKTRKLDSRGKGITVFVYEVTGKKEELTKYGEIMEAEKHTWKDEDGTVLWFTVRPIGMSGKLCISTNNKIYADTTAMDLANSMIEQYGHVGQILAKDILKNGFVSDRVSDPVPDPNELL